MDTKELFGSCRGGDVAHVQHLLEQREFDPNVRDQWDSTPLYYACLCGHEELVTYLLENGAKCEANTFDGERCLYAARTDEIRGILRKYKVVTSQSMKKDLYANFLKRQCDGGEYGDITFCVHGTYLKSHRCILSARSEYFADMFHNRWKDRQVIQVTHKLVQTWAFKAILWYLHTARLEVQVDQVDDILRIARQCRLVRLITELEDRYKKVVSLQLTKPGVVVTTLCIEPSPDCRDLQMDLGYLADQSIPISLTCWAGIELPFAPEQKQFFADVCFSVEGHIFKCHKVFFCGRSDYFKALLCDHFNEALGDQTGYGLKVMPLHDTKADTFLQVMYYVYQESCELTTTNVYDVLCAADMYLLPGLKRICAKKLSSFIDIENVVGMLRTARLFNLTKLEDYCAEYIAGNLEKVLENEEFADFVVEDARSVQNREVTDTVPIIDEIRYHITCYIQTYSEVYEANRKLALIDHFLVLLQINA